MKQIDRLNRLIGFLKEGPQTVDTIERYFGGELTPRQIRRLIDAIELIGFDRKEFEATGRANKKTWHIKSSLYERNTQRLLRGVLPRVFSIKRQELVEKLVGKLDVAVDSTHFYETEAHRKLDENLEIIVTTIDLCKTLKINGIFGDSTSIGNSINFPIDVLPISIRYHRGCFYLVSVLHEKVQPSVVTFQVDQLSLTIIDKSFERQDYVELVESALKYRFGISQNIDDEVYDIRLRFSSTTGEFVKNQFWHDEMNAPQRDGDGWIIEFQCGINRELVGWLFQWMSNVKVLGPQLLIDLYNEQLDKMQDLRHHADNDPLEYTNRFAPKV